MARTVALLLATVIALGAIFITWNALRLPDTIETLPPPGSPGATQPSANVDTPETRDYSPEQTDELGEPLACCFVLRDVGAIGHDRPPGVVKSVAS